MSYIRTQQKGTVYAEKGTGFLQLPLLFPFSQKPSLTSQAAEIVLAAGGFSRRLLGRNQRKPSVYAAFRPCPIITHSSILRTIPVAFINASHVPPLPRLFSRVSICHLFRDYPPLPTSPTQPFPHFLRFFPSPTLYPSYPSPFFTAIFPSPPHPSIPTSPAPFPGDFLPIPCPATPTFPASLLPFR